MIINSNDIFNQIGLVVDPNKKSNYNTKPKYVICLEIQLNQDQKYILEVKDFDDPYTKANQFCQKHRLNKLAVQIVQTKIRQAMEHQQQKIIKSKMKSVNNSIKQKKTQNNNTKYQSKSPNRNIKPSSPTKIKKQNKASPQKSRIKQLQNSQSKSKSKSKSKPKLSKTASTDNIYLRSLIKSRMLQQRRNKMKVQIQKKQQQHLTFKPTINNVSEKIVQFLKSNNIPKPKKQTPPKKLYDQMKQCTFKPKINKVSQIIVNNKSILKQQRQNHKNLFDELNSSEISKKKSAQQQYSFKPQINPKSSQKITVPFFKRLELAQQKKTQATTKQKYYDEQQCSFKPKINRGPLKDRSKQNIKIWEYLHNYTKKQTDVCPKDTTLSQIKQTNTSQQYYQNLIQDRINNVFTILDSNNDGLISPNQIAIEQLPTQCLHFLKPIFLQMDQIDAILNRYQFKKAVIGLMNDSDPGTKGAFIAAKWKKQIYDHQNFQPQINKRSKQLATNRSVQNLYKEGLREKQNKQYRLQKQRALKEEKQLMECSFKPVLNHSSKMYIDRVIKKKIDEQHKPNKNINEERHSFGKSFDDGLF